MNQEDANGKSSKKAKEDGADENALMRIGNNKRA